MYHPYQEILTDFPDELAEACTPYHFFSERHLQAVWLEQRYFKNLTTTQGEPITVISPGIWNAEAGPDFLKAHLRIGTKEVKGDIELHLEDNGWTQHKHHLDDRYSNVVFHLSLWESKQNKPILTKKGQSVAKAFLEPFLTIPISRIEQLIDLDLYPYKKFVGSGSCAQALFRDLSSENIVTFFKSAADWRLLQKQNFLESHQSNPADQLALGVALALGYKNNTEPFLELFNLLLPLRQMDEQTLLALSLGVCRFFESSYQKKWGSSSALYQQLNKVWEKLYQTSHYPPGCSISLKLNQIRPYNHPIRRLVYLTQFLHHVDFQELYTQIILCWQTKWEIAITKSSWSHLKQELLNLIPTYEDSYWNHHYNFESETREEFLALIGEDFKNLVLINTFFPLIRKHLEFSPQTGELEAFEKFYLTLTGSKSGKVDYLVHRFFGDTPKGKVLNKACMEQGALQLHRDFCTNFEASCDGCPFVDNYQNFFIPKSGAARLALYKQ